MSGSEDDKRPAGRTRADQQAEEADAARHAEGKKAALRADQRRVALAGTKVAKGFVADAFEATAERIERRAGRLALDKVEAKRRIKEKAAICPLGVKVVPGTRIVPDPLNVGNKLSATVNLAEHPLEMMLARRRLDQAHYEAGVRYRQLYERAMIGPGRGVDPAKIKVDGGKLGDPMSDEVAGAHMELARLARFVGVVGEKVLSEVAGRGTTISDLAQAWDGPEHPRVKLDYLGLRFKEALEVLACEVWGATGPRAAAMRSERGLGGDVDPQAVASANQRFLNKRGIVGIG
jgi:hypothetical protein